MNYDVTVFAQPGTWISLLTLTFLEIVLGVDNIIFISLVANKLPHRQQKKGRSYGLLIAMVVRLILLSLLVYIIGLTKPLFHLPIEGILQSMGVENPADAANISVKDIILFAGGLFLIAKSTSEIHGKVEGSAIGKGPKSRNNFFAVIFQIVLIDIVFSFDSILTAIGLTQQILVMMLAVVISMFIMLQFSGYISNIINKYPTLQMLALAFLILIGFTLVLEGIGIHINKGFIYMAVVFSLGVELLNIRLRKRGEV